MYWNVINNQLNYIYSTGEISLYLEEIVSKLNLGSIESLFCVDYNDNYPQSPILWQIFLQVLVSWGVYVNF